ncbi:hypothetical protein ASD12_29685 [Mesorhizobium sp. Root102]|uniref:hypothetical protein n=1 Tax=Mesorhizobium sp. Root102 TaxID=1736422 RepID=UPI000701BFD5|nr:hypothetical protein [Mesorhizobium sp. Root102]KQU88240.1 hypothetical protein ASD12_29685 [Mesorhizobium sp. Root102]
MRIVFTSLFAFIIFGFAGGLVSQLLAVASHAQEEYILARLFSDAPTIINWRALCAIVLFVLIRLGLIGWTFSQPIRRRGLINAQVGA